MAAAAVVAVTMLILFVRSEKQALSNREEAGISHILHFFFPVLL
jgi:hypothetical protein